MKIHFERIKEIKDRLWTYHEEDAKSAKIRSKLQWQLEGEKCTKFFFNLEGNVQGANLMTSLWRDDGSVTEEPEEILSEVSKYYQRLYTKNETSKNDQDVMLDKLHKKISLSQKEQCEKPLTLDDLERSVKQMEKDLMA